MFFCVKEKKAQAVYISISPAAKGGGANSFAYNFVKWLRPQREFRWEKNLLRADKAIIIADKADPGMLVKARQKGIFIIHRIDEYFESQESDYRRKKHAAIFEINRLADITVYQSNFVLHNAHVYLNPRKYAVIINGADCRLFYAAPCAGAYIGHVSWSYDQRKRLDIVYDLVRRILRRNSCLTASSKD